MKNGENKQKTPYTGTKVNMYGIRTSEKTSAGKYSVCFAGAGINNMGLYQQLNIKALNASGMELQDSELKVSCDVYVDSYKQGVIKPIHFVIVDGTNSHYVGKVFSNKEMRLKQWANINFALNFDQYKDIKYIIFYTTGWKVDDGFFEGKFYVDNVKINIEKKGLKNKLAPAGDRTP